MVRDVEIVQITLQYRLNMEKLPNLYWIYKKSDHICFLLSRILVIYLDLFGQKCVGQRQTLACACRSGKLRKVPKVLVCVVINLCVRGAWCDDGGLAICGAVHWCLAAAGQQMKI